MTIDSDMDLETQVAEWRTYMRRHRAVDGADVD
jgi:hypothetical protein